MTLERSASRHRTTFWAVVVGVVLLDVITKQLAVRYLMPQHTPHEMIGDWVRLTLVYNRGAAFGLHLGPHSRWIFLLLSVGALYILARLYRTSGRGDLVRVTSIALVSGGAVGNLIDRVRHDLGVVDFLDVGIGDMRWPTFNVADIAVSTGAVLLAWVLWGEDSKLAQSLAPDRRRAPRAKPSQRA